MIIYHGSEKIIEKPVYAYGNPHNDYGLGFYCTEHKELAKEWACAELRNGYANEYRLDTEGLSVLDLKGGGYHILNWLAVLIENRGFAADPGLQEEARHYLLEHFGIEYRNYDIIRGYRADDSYFTFARNFLSGSISLQLLSQSMVLGELGEQIVLISKNAFERIEFVDAHEASFEQYYSLKCARDLQAKERYRELRTQSDIMQDIFITDMIRGGWDNADARLQQFICR